MKKLFFTLLMLCVAMVGWSQKLSKDFTGGVLTITYTGGGVTADELKQLVGGPADGIAHHATKIVFNGPFTNKDISDAINGFIGHVAKPGPDNTIEVDLSGCSEAVCLYNGKPYNNTTSYLPKENNAAYSTTEYNVTPVTANFYDAYSQQGDGSTIHFVVTGLPAELDQNTTYTDISASDGAYNNQTGLNVYYRYGKWWISIWGEKELIITSGTGYSYTDNAGVSHVVREDDPNLNADKTKYTEVKNLGTDEFKLGDNFKDKVSKLTFPASPNFKMIPNEVCEEYKKLQEITMPNQIEVVGNEAFNESSVDSVNWSIGLVLIGGKSFHSSAIKTANLTACTALQEIDFESFEECNALTVVMFPSGSTLTKIGNDAFRKSGLKNVDMSMCQGITEFTFENSAYRQFSKCPNLITAILPPNLTKMPYCDGGQVFADCDNITTITFTGVARYENNKLANPFVIEKSSLALLHSLVNVNFSNNLVSIGEDAFNQCYNLDQIRLENCHELRLIAKQAFDNCSQFTGSTDDNNLHVTNGIQEVHLCSHPKVIESLAFLNVKSINRVEIHGCPNTDMADCICQNRGFEYDITHHQTAAMNAVEECALLVFPNPAPTRSPYTSSWDFFVGDYKNGTLITQENLLCLYRVVPAEGYGESKRVDNDVDEYGNVIYDETTGLPKTHDVNKVPFECQYQKGNGWHEFLNVGRGQTVPKGEFLRTYSRTAGDGPCFLPKEITAYRAIDYHSTATGWVKDKKKGTHYCINPSKPETERTDADYAEITKDTPKSLYANGNRYSQLTIGGTLYLRPLVPKVANLIVNGQTVPYDDEKFTSGDDSFKNDEGEYMTHKEWYDDYAQYQRLTSVPGGRYSYVPEETGVVLYSENITEDAFLLLPGDFGTETVYKKYPHTSDRYEEGRLISDNTDDDINMLHGTFGDGWAVAPVFPWNYADEELCKGGKYGKTKEYRNFACVIIKAGGTTVTETGSKLYERNIYGWQRLQPGIMRVNRAFAQIPTNRFDNHNEGVDQMPDFTITDLPEDYYESTEEGDVGGPANMMLLSIFEDKSEGDAVVDGIKTVNTNVVNVNNDAWYTIQGVRVAQPTKGVYIHNGKKVVIK